MATRPTLMGTHAAISTEHYLSTQAGLDVMRAGGNAADAAVAATLVECLVNPHLVGFGGELLALIAQGSAVHCIDGNTTAPNAATIDWFKTHDHPVIPGRGLLPAGPPGMPHALLTLLARFGTYTLEQAAGPAIALAEDGFAMEPGLRGPSPKSTDMSIAGNEKQFREWPSTAKVYLPDGALPEAGARFRNPDLAAVWRKMIDAEKAAGGTRAQGLEAAAKRFYREDIAERIAAHAEQNGGLLRYDDIAAYESLSLPPVMRPYRGFDVYKCGPGTQGPVMLQQLALLEGFDLAAMPFGGVDYVHTVAECAKLAFADRDHYYGDPAYVDVPVADLISDRYADVRRTLIDPNLASKAERPGDPIGMHPLLQGHRHPSTSWGTGTVSVQVVDPQRMMVSLSPSGGWIAWSPLVDGLGFPLGTRLQLSSLEEGHPNALKPGKRPRTTLSPTIVMRERRPYIALGTPGADTQDQWNLQVLLALLDYRIPLQEAIEAPHFSSMYFFSSFSGYAVEPGVLHIEDRFAPAVRDALAARGHVVKVRPPYSEGENACVLFDAEHDVVHAGSDIRATVVPHLPTWCAVF